MVSIKLSKNIIARFDKLYEQHMKQNKNQIAILESSDDYARDFRVPEKLKEVEKQEIMDIWKGLADRTENTKKEAAARKSKNASTSKVVDVSKIDKVKVTRQDGSVDIIEPVRIAKLVKFYISQLSKYEDTRILAKYFPKSIIWTFEVPTAATDGIRVFFNPAYADRLLGMDMVLAENRMKDDPTINPDEISGTMVQYVLIHEIYHQIYRHMNRVKMKPETANAANNPAVMELCNVAMDVEINRDIEFLLPRFAGCTKIDGLWDNRFTHQTWEVIYDAYNDPSNDINAPRMPHQLAGKNPQLGLSGQNQLSDLSDQNGDNNSDNNGNGGNNLPQLNNRSEAFLKGLKQALKDFNSGKLDLDNWTGIQDIVNEDIDFNTMLNYRTKGAKGKKTLAREAEAAALAAALVSPTQTVDNTTLAGPAQSATIPQQTSNYDFSDEEFRKGYEYAIEQLKKLKEQLNQQNNQNQQNNGDGNDDDDMMTYDERSHGSAMASKRNQNNGLSGQGGSGSGGGDDDDSIQDDSNVSDTISGEGMEAFSGDDSVFGNDLIDREMGKRLAENAGQPYDADDMNEDPEQKAKDFTKKNRDALSKIGKNKGAGKGRSMSEVLDQIDEMFKVTVNWKNQLQSFLNSLAKTGRDYEMQRRRIGSDNPNLKASKYIKYNEVIFDEKTSVAQVFYLIDNSGSMYSQSKDGGQSVFMQIFSDILNMQKRAKIQKSALTYFSYGTIDKAKIRLWTSKTSTSRIKELIGRNKDDSGGTDIMGSITLIYNMGKPYYNRHDPKTLMIVMTDGEDNLTILKDLPIAVKLNIIFMILNSAKNYLDLASSQLEKAGIKRSRILLVDTNDIAKK